jgi:hypothetical protein
MLVVVRAGPSLRPVGPAPLCQSFQNFREPIRRERLSSRAFDRFGQRQNLRRSLALRCILFVAAISISMGGLLVVEGLTSYCPWEVSPLCLQSRNR